VGGTRDLVQPIGARVAVISPTPLHHLRQPAKKLGSRLDKDGQHAKGATLTNRLPLFQWGGWRAPDRPHEKSTGGKPCGTRQARPTGRKGRKKVIGEPQIRSPPFSKTSDLPAKRGRLPLVSVSREYSGKQKQIGRTATLGG